MRKCRRANCTPAAANAAGTTLIVEAQVRILPVPLWPSREAYGTVAQWVEHTNPSPRISSLPFLPSGGSLSVSLSLSCGDSSTAESRVANSRIRVRFPATAPVECRRESIGNRESECGFEARGGSKESLDLFVSRRPLSRGECREDYTHPATVVPSGTRVFTLLSPPFHLLRRGAEAARLAHNQEWWNWHTRQSEKLRPTGYGDGYLGLRPKIARLTGSAGSATSPHDGTGGKPMKKRMRRRR
jgi:hypothetical protein